MSPSPAEPEPNRLKEPFDLRIPDELRARPQWVAWWNAVGEGIPLKLPGGGWSKALKKQEKPHKLPIDPQTGALAASTRPKTWSSFENAVAAVQRWSLTGVGFVFTDSDPFAGVDLDNCRNPKTCEIAEWAWVIIRTLDSYTEISPSGTGVHIFVRAQLPSGRGNQIRHHGGKVEMFSRARYFTFTGIQVDGTSIGIFDRQAELLSVHSKLFAKRHASVAAKESAPSSTLPASDSELIEKACRAKNGAKFDSCGRATGRLTTHHKARQISGYASIWPSGREKTRCAWMPCCPGSHRRNPGCRCAESPKMEPASGLRLF